MQTSVQNTLAVTSSIMREGQAIPNSMVYAGMGCKGDNTSPDLSWTGAPAGTKSFAVTLFDPDAPTTVGFWHWLLFDIDAKHTALDAGAGKKHHAPHGSTLGFTDFGENAYGGPCPPPGDAPHRYTLTVYALDTDTLGLDEKTTGAKLMFAMREHILAKGSITATYGVPA